MCPVAPNDSFKPSPLRGLVRTGSRGRAGLTQALAGARVGFSTLSSVIKPRIKGISCAVHFCQEQITTAIARAACRSGPSATRIGSGCNRIKSDQRLVSQLTIRSSRVRFAASALALRSSHRRGLSAARLNSGVSPAEPQHRQRAQQDLPCPALAQGSGHNSGVMACAW